VVAASRIITAIERCAESRIKQHSIGQLSTFLFQATFTGAAKELSAHFAASDNASFPFFTQYSCDNAKVVHVFEPEVLRKSPDYESKLRATLNLR
jgi:hypothetical protein